MPQEEDNKALVTRLIEAVNSRDDASLDELVAPDCEIIGPAGSGRGPAIYRQVFALLRAAFPDVQVTIEEIRAAEGDRVIVRTRTSGTHRGAFMGVPPTEKLVSWAGVNVLRVCDGRIASSWGLQDRLAVLEHMGVSTASMLSSR